VIDPLWNGPVAVATEAAAPRARIVHYGQSAGPEATFKSGTVRGKELELLGVSNFARTNTELRDLHGDLLRHVLSGEIQIDYETFGLDQVEEAWSFQASGGKAVIQLNRSN
jgi:NADPH:quinone reductase-like Zn-dependent oxidoreductase